MTSKFRKGLAVAGLALVALASQPALADGWHHYGGEHYHGGRGWVPFAVGAVLGGVAVGAMMQPPQPVYVQPAYPQPIYMRPRVMMPPPAYIVPAPPPVYYGY